MKHISMFLNLYKINFLLYWYWKKLTCLNVWYDHFEEIAYISDVSLLKFYNEQRYKHDDWSEIIEGAWENMKLKLISTDSRYVSGYN